MRTAQPTTLSCIAGLLVVTSVPATASLSGENSPSPVTNQSMPEPPPPPTPPPPSRAVSFPPASPSTRPAQPVNQARAASPRNQRRWFERILETYPARAKREGIEGTVGVRVTVTPQGRASNCQITSSSGSELLDEAACKGIERFGRFNLALDEAGNPTSGTFATRITYALSPDDRKAVEPAEKPPTTEEWEAELAEMEAGLAKHRGGSKEYDEALAWLDDLPLFTHASSSGDGSAVFMRGFINIDQITPERLNALNEGSIKPNLWLTKPEESTREPIQIIHSRLIAGVPQHCVILLQVHRRSDTQDLGDFAYRIDAAPYISPTFALDSECQSNTPWEGETKLGNTFEWDNTTSFVAEGGFVRIDKNLSCDGLVDITSGHFTLSTFATIQTEFFTNLPLDSERVERFRGFEARPFGSASRFFTFGVTRAEPSDVRDMKLVFDPAIVGDTNDILARFSVLNDDENDEFCIVTRVEQNASVFQRILRIPREGRRLGWGSERARSTLYNPEEIRNFAKTIGAEFRTLANVEPNS